MPCAGGRCGAAGSRFRRRRARGRTPPRAAGRRRPSRRRRGGRTRAARRPRPRTRRARAPRRAPPRARAARAALRVERIACAVAGIGQRAELVEVAAAAEARPGAGERDAARGSGRVPRARAPRTARRASRPRTRCACSGRFERRRARRPRARRAPPARAASRACAATARAPGANSGPAWSVEYASDSANSPSSTSLARLRRSSCTSTSDANGERSTSLRIASISSSLAHDDVERFREGGGAGRDARARDPHADGGQLGQPLPGARALRIGRRLRSELDPHGRLAEERRAPLQRGRIAERMLQLGGSQRSTHRAGV